MEEKKQDEIVNNEPKPKKSELVAEMKTLEEQYNKAFEEFLNKEFSVVVGSRKRYNALRKFVENDMPVNYSTSVNANLLMSNLKQQNEFTKAEDWNGEILLNTTSCQILCRAIQAWEGHGAYAARDFLDMLNEMWESLVRHIQTINADQESMRGLHVRLSEIDDILSNPDAYENDMPDEEVESVVKKEEELKESIEEEINPEV